MREAKILNERAKRFFENAIDNIKKDYFDLAAFHLEQALQLKIKYILAIKIGFFSKTHSLSLLIEELSKVIKKSKNFFLKYREEVEELELAYTGARYLPIAYSREKLNKLLKFVKKAFSFLDKYEK